MEVARIAFTRTLHHSTAPMARPNLRKFRRIVVKVGSSLLIDSGAGEARASWLAALAAYLPKPHGKSPETLTRPSGSIAAGRPRLHPPPPPPHPHAPPPPP